MKISAQRLLPCFAILKDLIVGEICHVQFPFWSIYQKSTIKLELAVQWVRVQHWGGLAIKSKPAGENHQKDWFPLGKIGKFPTVASNCSTLPFVSFAKPCLIGPRPCLLYVGYTEDSSPNISSTFLLCSYFSSACFSRKPSGVRYFTLLECILLS